MGREGYRALLVWQRAKALAVSVYNLTNSGVFERDYGMKDQNGEFQNECLELGKMLGALIKARSKSARIRT